MTNVIWGNFLINFGFASKIQKQEVLREHADKLVYMDLTCYNPQEFYQNFPQLRGSFAALFCDERKKMEIHFRQRNEEVLQKLQHFGFTPVETQIISCGFIFPRTIVQIINEAYYALDQGIASAQDIDRAMQFGVNYPLGPFAWAKGRELYVKTLLQELYALTGDKRYNLCPLLQ